MRTIKPLPLIKPRDNRHLYRSEPSTDYRAGILILIITWVIFIVSLLAALGIWTIPNTIFQNVPDSKLDEYGDLLDDFPISNYYSIAILLVPVGFWIWSYISWTALNLFKHSKGANAGK